MGLLTKKSVSLLIEQANEEGQHTLRRALSKFDLTIFGIGAVVGAGIFVLTGQAAAVHAGPGIVISFLIAGFVALLAALCYAELASMIPVSGSAYTYTYATLGEFAAWVIAWDLIAEYLFATSTLAVGWSGYFCGLMKSMGITLPAVWTTSPLNIDSAQHFQLTGAYLNLPAVAIICVVTIILLMGVVESARFTNLVVIIKLIVVLLVIGFGLAFSQVHNWVPFVPEQVIDRDGVAHYGWQGVFAGAGLVFYAYIGFETVSTAAQETLNPEQTIPFSILTVLAICTALYILVSLVLTGLAPYRALDVPAPIYTAIEFAGPALVWLKPVVTIGAVVGLTSGLITMLYGQSRIFYAMSRDGLLPPLFSRLQARRRTPWAGTLITASVAAALAAVFPIGLLGELVSIGTLLAFALICGAVLYLRVTAPELTRRFRTPMIWLVAPLGVVACGVLITSLPSATFFRLVGWLVLGLVVYFCYGYRRKQKIIPVRRGF